MLLDQLIFTVLVDLITSVNRLWNTVLQPTCLSLNTKCCGELDLRCLDINRSGNCYFNAFVTVPSGDSGLFFGFPLIISCTEQTQNDNGNGNNGLYSALRQ